MTYNELTPTQQAQHTPGTPIEQTYIDDLKTELANQSFLVAKDMERIAELAAEVERLRGMLAEAYEAMLAHHLSRAGDLGVPHDRAMETIRKMPLMQRIEAAKEAAK